MLDSEGLLTIPQTLSSAANYGMIQQANLKGQEFSLLVALFYIGYLVAEYPSNYLMQKFPTGKYLTVNFILWGMSDQISYMLTLAHEKDRCCFIVLWCL